MNHNITYFSFFFFNIAILLFDLKHFYISLKIVTIYQIVTVEEFFENNNLFSIIRFK